MIWACIWRSLQYFSRLFPLQTEGTMKDFKVHASQMFLLRISVMKLNWQQMKIFSASQIFLLRKISVFLIKTSEKLSSFMFISLHFYDTNLYLFLSEASQAKLMLLVNNNYSIKSPVQWDRETCQNKSPLKKEKLVAVVRYFIYSCCVVCLYFMNVSPVVFLFKCFSVFLSWCTSFSQISRFLSI